MSEGGITVDLCRAPNLPPRVALLRWKKLAPVSINLTLEEALEVELALGRARRMAEAEPHTDTRTTARLGGAMRQPGKEQAA